MKKKFLTKSRFKLALDCPTKLYYTGNKEYHNQSSEDSFLKALAEGGFQVGELAKAYYPNGHDIKSLDKDLAVSETNEFLKQDKVVIFEAAIKTNDYFIRVDVLVKNGNSLHLIEVKAKSIDPNLENQFWHKTQLKKGFNKLSAEWKPYLYDIAFQKAVTAIARPDFNITCSLMLADKSKEATVDGLNQMFAIKREPSGRSYSERVHKGELGDKVLSTINVDHEVSHIINGSDFGQFNRQELGLPSFHEEMKKWANAYESVSKIAPVLGSHCKNCEFKSSSGNSKSGFHECWKIDQNEQTVLNIWNFRGSKKLISEGVLLLESVNTDDIPESKPADSGMTMSERQTIQLEKYKSNDQTPYIDSVGLGFEMSTWTYPLNFIDFETSMVAIPFNKGRRPYEQMAFQFSHHILNKDGSIEHIGEYINTEPGVFPNFEFVRKLKSSLDQNKGSIFRYSNHENTVLIQIMNQLKKSEEPDKDELIDWIQTVTIKKEKKNIIWCGDRNMIDLWDLVKKYYYHPKTNGSNSIKAVLPAILFESTHLQDKYSKPIYGSDIKSHNFNNWVWLKKDNLGNIIDPYKQLEPLEKTDIENAVFGAEVIKDGGGAATGYAAMQFLDMTQEERESITTGLLRYCELDTLAMVLIVEHWSEVLNFKAKAAS